MSMITAATWVPRGKAARFPVKFETTDEESAEMERLAALHLDEAKKDLKDSDEKEEEEDDDDEVDEVKEKKERVQGLKKDSEFDDDLKEFDLEHYDDSEEEDGLFGLFGNARSLAYHESNDDDPYITIKDAEFEDEDREELEILPTDSLVLGTVTNLEDGLAHLNVYVYEDSESNLFLHHDVPLADIPLAVEWFGFAPGKPANGNPGGNFAAVATMGSDIEIWNLDMPDAIWPAAILGQSDPKDLAIAALSGKSGKSKSKSKKSKTPNDSYHISSVLSLAANRAHPNLLASGSADCTIKLWDLSTAKCAHSYSYHTGNVSSLAWHPTETTLLLSGSCDRTVCLADMRAPNAEPQRWTVPADVEVVRWNPTDPNEFYVATDTGLVCAFDVRAGSGPAAKPKWTLHAHDSDLTSLDINPVIPGFFVTSSSKDKSVKVWNIPPGANGPQSVVSRDLGIGAVFSTAFSSDPELAFRLVVTGNKGDQALQVWDLSTNPAARSCFGSRPTGTVAANISIRDPGTKETFVGVPDDEEDDSDHEDEGENGVEEDDRDDEMRDLVHSYEGQETIGGLV